MRIHSPVAGGSGAANIHHTLASAIEGYEVDAYDPRLEYFPPLLLARRRRADIVHAPPDHAALTAHPRSPLVVTFHNYVLDPGMRAYSSLAQRVHYRTDLRWLTRRALERAAVVTAVSRHTSELVQEDLGFRGRIEVIPNGVDERRFAPRSEPHDGVRVLFCGNVSRRKGGQHIQAVAEQLDPGVELVVAAGLRSQEQPFRENNIAWLGRVSSAEMPSLYNRVDILFHPAIREGLSLSVAEAMASGLPVVAASASSLPEQVHEGRGGYLCSADNAGMFAERINALASDADLRTTMGRYNRALIESRYRQEQMIEGYERIFRELAGGTGRREA